MFKLIGNSVIFKAVRYRNILSGTVEVVDGISLCGKYRTTARVIDTEKVK